MNFRNSFLFPLITQEAIVIINKYWISCCCFVFFCSPHNLGDRKSPHHLIINVPKMFFLSTCLSIFVCSAYAVVVCMDYLFIIRKKRKTHKTMKMAKTRWNLFSVFLPGLFFSFRKKWESEKWVRREEKRHNMNILDVEWVGK